MKKKYLLLPLILLFFNCLFAQSIKSNVLLKETEQALKEIKTVTYKINRSVKDFSSNDTINGLVVGTLYIDIKDKMGAYYILHTKSSEKKYNYHKYDGQYTSSLFYNVDSLSKPKRVTIENVANNNYGSIRGTYISNYLLKDYFKKQNIFKQYRSFLAKFLIKNITTEESTYLGTPVYILTIYGKDKPKENRINSSIEKYYIRKSDYLPIAQSFYGEFQGMKQTEFTEIEYLEINPQISLDVFQIDPSVKEVIPSIYYEQLQKYNL